MALLALVAVTAVWGVTFVPVKHAIALYPLFAFMTVRFAVATATLAIPAAPRLRLLGAPGLRAGAVLGGLLATGYALQTAGLQRTDVSSTGFITGLYVVLTPLFALVLFRSRIGVAVWLGVVCSVGGLALLAGVHAAGTMGDLLVLASTAAQALQIVFAERYAAQYDALALTFVEMLVALGAFFVVALALGDLHAPHGRTVWFAILVTGVFASALAYLVQLWAQRRIIVCGRRQAPFRRSRWKWRTRSSMAKLRRTNGSRNARRICWRTWADRAGRIHSRRSRGFLRLGEL